MLNQICLKTAEIILSVLSSQTEIKDNAVCNPIEYFNTIYRLQAGVLEIASKHALGPKCLFSRIQIDCSAAELEALNVFNKWFEDQNLKKVNLSDLYELMLLIEFPIQDGKHIADAENLDSIGSFYTPTNLAAKIVELTLDNYILKNVGIERFSSSNKSEERVRLVTELFLNSSFADYSCGTGSFLIAILRFCQSHLSFSTQKMKRVAVNFHAIEADSLSIEIAKIQVLEMIGDTNLHTHFNRAFVHGNPLIVPNQEYPDYDFCHEFYYHNGLAMDRIMIAKCDVIVGNPPWGTVEFDLQHYFHLLCPHLNKIEDESELEIAIDRLSETHPNLYKWLFQHDEAIDLACEEIYNDARFEHSTTGGLHTNVLFTELCDSLCAEKGTVGLLLKGSTLSDPINKRLKSHLESKSRIVARYDFSNQNQLFNIDREECFSIIILGDNAGNQAVHKKELTSLEQIL